MVRICLAMNKEIMGSGDNYAARTHCKKISVFIYEPSQAEREQKPASPTHVRTNPVSLCLLPLQSCLTAREWE